MNWDMKRSKQTIDWMILDHWILYHKWRGEGVIQGTWTQQECQDGSVGYGRRPLMRFSGC